MIRAPERFKTAAGAANIEPVSAYYDALCQQHRDAGMDVRNQTVQSRTLAAICEQYAQDRPIHFLKIDVESHEETVLRGMDFSRWRPWIILIETPWARDQVWETLVTDTGYQSILFDGINTYYLAEEHLALKPAFDIPPVQPRRLPTLQRPQIQPPRRRHEPTTQCRPATG